MTTEAEQLPPGRRMPPTDDFPTGPAIGEPLPDLTLPDQSGNPVHFSPERARTASVVFFHRSAAWCPYCRTHLVAFQNRLADFEAHGIEVYAISNDPVDVLSEFAKEHGITYPLLSDVDSAVIKRFGILNTLIAPDEPRYGIAYPGVYVVGTDGLVVEKMFHREYPVRESAASILKRIMGDDFDPGQSPRADVEGPGVRISARLGEPTLTFMQRTPLYVRLDLDPGLHVYGAPTPTGFTPTSVEVAPLEGLRVGAVSEPPTRAFNVEGITEAFRVYEGVVEFEVALISALRDQESITLDLRVQFQACDERQCYLPQTRSIQIEVPLSDVNRPKPRA